MSVCAKILVLVLVLVVVAEAASVREWKNFENGKVYSHRTSPSSKKREKPQEINQATVTEGRMLHGHHKDKKMQQQLRSNSLKDIDQKKHFPVTEPKSKNPERHHRKSVEEVMHLRPLNERHHKFPNPALLNDVNDGKAPSSQISRQKLVKQVKSRNKISRKRMLGRRYKRNRTDQIKQLFSYVNTTTESTVLKPHNSKTTESGIKEKSFGKIRKLRELKKDNFLPKLPYVW